MNVLPRALRSITFTYSKSELVAVPLMAFVIASWLAVAGGAFSWRALFACEAAFFAFYLAGALVLSCKPLAAGIAAGLPLRLLVGYSVINTALLALAWLSPLGIVANFALLLALTIATFLGSKERKRVQGCSISLGAIALCLVASSLWCQDSIQPRVEQGSVVIFKPWVDGFYHAVHIKIFAASHGASSIEDWRLVGIPARPYHYAMYMLPAWIKQAAGIDSYTVFAGALAPVGVFFTGLAAYAFVASWWGAWPGLCAVAALVLLPDGAQQGMQNTFMSYHWLTQISPSATHGLAMMAVAWLFVLQGCRRGSRLQVAAGWLFAAMALAYKLHYVLANAFLLLLVPALFFRGHWGRGRRGLWVVAACCVYAAVLAFAQRIPGVPLIRFDGSSVGEILRLVHTFARPGALKDYALQHMGPKFSVVANLLFGVPYVLLAALGLLAPLLVILALWGRRRMRRMYVLFPFLLIGNFLVMFFGLALDFSSSTPDELSHRPLMIVYFFVVTWVGGAAGFLLTRAAPPRVVRYLVVATTILLLLVPAHLGAGVQQMWVMPQMSPVRLPSSLVRVADYMRAHGGAEDVFQHSQFDRSYALAALSERRTFVAHTLTRVPFRAELVETRTAAVDRFMGLRSPKAISATARAFGFRWFLLERGDTVDWPAEIARAPVLETGPFKLYEFGPKPLE